MTVSRKDNHSTEFGLWLRQQAEIDSKLGYLATNIDFMWQNYKTGEWMLIEEKRYGSKPKRWQRMMFKTLNKVCKIDPKFKGFNLIVFQKTNPDDGKIYLNNTEINKDHLIKLLQFKL